MAGFLTRTKHLDKHVAHRLRTQADATIEADVLDIDAPVLYELASKFSKHEDTEAISKWLRHQDTAFRDSVPRMVLDILKDNDKGH